MSGRASTHTYRLSPSDCSSFGTCKGQRLQARVPTSFLVAVATMRKELLLHHASAWKGEAANQIGTDSSSRVPRIPTRRGLTGTPLNSPLCATDLRAQAIGQVMLNLWSLFNPKTRPNPSPLFHSGNLNGFHVLPIHAAV